MSTSLKVVSMAAVFCASFRRRAMVWRSRVMRTRSSRAASSGGAGARICTAAAVAATGVGAAAARSMAASMSPLVTRPSLPDPATLAASTPDSAASLRTEGASGASVGFADAGAALVTGLGASLDAAAGENGADGDRIAILGGNIREYAGRRRRHFDRHLVGFKLDQGFVHRDDFARFLEPFADGRLGDRFTQRRHAYLSHGLIPDVGCRMSDDRDQKSEIASRCQKFPIRALISDLRPPLRQRLI